MCRVPKEKLDDIDCSYPACSKANMLEALHREKQPRVGHMMWCLFCLYFDHVPHVSIHVAHVGHHVAHHGLYDT